MSRRSKWALAYVCILICAFAFGIGYGIAFEEALADNKCQCTLYFPSTGEMEPAKQYGEWPNVFCDWEPIDCFDCPIAEK